MSREQSEDKRDEPKGNRTHDAPCQDCVDAYTSAWEDGLLMGHKDCLKVLFAQDGE